MLCIAYYVLLRQLILTTNVPVITVDGPSGVGKGTLCKAIANLLQWNFLDSGAIYRILALVALRHHVNIFSEKSIVALAINLGVDFFSANKHLETILEGRSVINDIYAQEIANTASIFASFPYVRNLLLGYQRSFIKLPGLVADGRDMGTVVFPDAQVKIFLDSSLEERVYRRMLQLQKKGFSANSRQLLLEIQERDDRDRNRVIAPLIPAKDALVIDSSNLNIEQLIEKVLQYIRQKVFLLLNE